MAWSILEADTDALDLTEQAVQFRESKLGDEHPDILQSMHHLAIRYGEAGRKQEALPVTEQAMLLWKGKLGGGYPDTLQRTVSS